MAINTQVPIIPIAVKGGFNYKPKTRWYIKPSIIDIEVGNPIDVSKYTVNDIDSLIDDTRKEFLKLLNEQEK